MQPSSFEYRNFFDLHKLTEGEVLEVATDRSVYHFKRIGTHIKLQNSFGTDLADEMIEALDMNESSEVAINSEMVLPSHHIEKPEFVILIRMLTKDILAH